MAAPGDSASFPVTSLDYTLSATGGVPSDVRSRLMQKQDGSYYLLLWRNLKVWDEVNRADISNAQVTVTVNLAGGKKFNTFTKLKYGISTSSTSDADWGLINVGSSTNSGTTTQSIAVSDSLTLLKFTVRN